MLASDPVDLEQLERRLRELLDALGPAPRAELLHVLMLPDFERADRMHARATAWERQRPQSRTRRGALGCAAESDVRTVGLRSPVVEEVES